MTYGEMIAKIQCYIHHVKNVKVMLKFQNTFVMLMTVVYLYSDNNK